MPRKTVTEIDTPWQRGWASERIVGRAGKEATDTAEDQPDDQRSHKKIASPALNAVLVFYGFNRNPAAEDPAHDGSAPVEQEQGMPAEDHCKLPYRQCSAQL